MGGLFLRLRTWWETADRTQKVVTLFGGTFLILLLAGTFYFGSRPKMTMAWGGLSPSDQGKVVAEIQKLGIPVEYDLRGGVLVPSDRVAEVQSAISKSGNAPLTGHMGNGDLANMGPMSTKPVEEARLKAIREGEIAKSIETISGVAAARVLLSGGERSAFAAEEEPPSASVTLTERAGASLGGDESKAIASLVARAVPGLKTKDVTIVNQEGATLFDGAVESGQTGKYTARLEAQINEARRIKRELQAILDNAYGPGNTIVTARVDMDFDEAKVDTRTPIAAESPLSKQSSTETMGDGANRPLATPPAAGLGANGGVGAPSTLDANGGAGNAKYNSKQEHIDYGSGEIKETKTRAPGAINAMAISVLVDSKKITDTKPVQELLEGYLGPNKDDKQKYSAMVTSAEFDRSDEKKVEQAATATAGKERLQQILAMLPVAALVLVAFVVLKALGKAARSENVLIQALPDGRLITVGGKPGGSMPQGMLGRATVMAEGGSSASAGRVEYADDGEEEDVYEEIEDDSGAKSWKPKKRKKGPRVEDIEDIPDQINVPLEQIRKMGVERPTVAAMLIKSWLITD